MKHSFERPAKQQGVVLVVALVLLVMISLFAVSAIRSSTLELQIVGNEQIRQELAVAAQEEIEARMSSMILFNNLISGVTVVPTSTTRRNGQISVSATVPVCIRSEPITGTSLVHTGVGTSETTYWEVRATANDTVTGGTFQATQGFRMRMPASSCPLP
jgi:Tfp pilus assembly protein PilX